MKIIAHRGWPARYPEHTAVGYEKALELPIHGVECDVRLTRDGELVLIHDPVVDRVADGRGRVSAQRLAGLRELNFGDDEHPQQVLTLPELIDMVAPTDKHLYIETKHPLRYGRMLEEQVVRALQHASLLDDPRFHFISFSAPAMMRMRRLAPQVDRIHLRRNRDRWLNPLDRHPGRPTGLGMSLLRAKMHPHLIGHRGLPTYLWTLNEPEDVRWALEHGVDMVATDHPDMALRVCLSHGKEEQEER